MTYSCQNIVNSLNSYVPASAAISAALTCAGASCYSLYNEAKNIINRNNRDEFDHVSCLTNVSIAVSTGVMSFVTLAAYACEHEDETLGQRMVCSAIC